MSTYAVNIDGKVYELDFELPLQRGQEFTVQVGDECLRVRVPGSNGIEWLIVNDRPYEVHYDANARWLQGKEDVHTVDVQDRDTTRARPASADGRVKAPIPGMIARLLVAPGQRVELGQPMLILEAMKMENEIRAPRSGTVGALHVEIGRVVKRSELLAEIV
jgi:biotin carboxyl carrier protein